MTIPLRLLLVAGAVFTTCYFGLQIKKGKLDIQYSLFWILFSLLLVLLSIFPQMLVFFAKLIGVESPVNLLFLGVIFVLFIREFSLTIRISQLEEKNKQMIQTFSLANMKDTQKKTEVSEKK